MSEQKSEGLFCFEGCEKRLQLEFNGRGDLRDIPLSIIQNIVKAARCEIVESRCHPTHTAYLLSESSLFVYPHQMIIKTCGTTTLIKCIPQVLEAAFDVECFCDATYYSRSSFMFPEKQPFPYDNWRNEVAQLEVHFTGTCSTFGNANGQEWHVYSGSPRAFDGSSSSSDENGTTNPLNFNSSSGSSGSETDDVVLPYIGLPQSRAKATSPRKRYLKVKGKKKKPGNKKTGFKNGKQNAMAKFQSKFVGVPKSSSRRGRRKRFRDQASNQSMFELCMFKLDPAKMAVFYRREGVSGRDVTVACGLQDALPGFEIHEFLFSPCGYSCNATMGDFYFTVHISPEDHCSFVSFETNLTFPCPQMPLYPSFSDLAQKLISLFRPGKFSLHMLIKPKLRRPLSPSIQPIPILSEKQVSFDGYSPEFDNGSIQFSNDCVAVGHSFVKARSIKRLRNVTGVPLAEQKFAEEKVPAQAILC